MVTIEQNKRLSECLLWGMERAYFERMGIEAWLHDVPFYVTSNTFIAKSYAKIVIHFIRDWIANHPEAKKHPFYVMELGTGPGRFSYYTVKALEELRRDYGMDDVKIVFVVTDFAQANLDYHKTHHALVPYIEKGLLDLAIFDMDNHVPVKLVHSKTVLDQKTLINPITLFANYVFDTIPNDAFNVQNGQLYELQVNLTTPASNLQNNRPIAMDGINVEFHPKEIQGAYYNDPALNAVLDEYKNAYQNSSFLVPVNSIKGLTYLSQLANGNMMLISSDKAYSDIASMDNLDYPSLTIHGGCFSMMVNCHAIGQYFKNIGGDFFPSSTRPGLKTCFYTTGCKLSDLPETRAAVKECIEQFSPSDFFNVYRHFNETAQYGELGNIASYLQMSEWDPQAYTRISTHILNKLSETNMEVITFMANHMHQLAENYYYMPSADCIVFEVAVFFHTIHDYGNALHYYQKAEKFMGDEFRIKYNLALCYNHLDQKELALQNFKRALELNPDSEEAKNWINYLQTEGGSTTAEEI